MYQMNKLSKMMIENFTYGVDLFNNSLAGTIFHNPVAHHYNQTLKVFTPSDDKPEWNIEGLIPVKIQTEVSSCDLVKFVERGGDGTKPNMLVVAPISGHYATLLRGTVERLSKDYTVFVTDWKNVRDHPELKDFNLDDYSLDIYYLCFHIGDAHILAVCQSTIPVLRMMCVDPLDSIKSLTLMAGPIDTRRGRTSINEFCDGKDIEWFEDNVIHRVPGGYKSEGYHVYPGCLQLTGFMSMNPKAHQDKFNKHFIAGISGEFEEREGIEKFYDEYLSVMDLPSQFYLDTIQDVFLDQKLVKGTDYIDHVHLDLSYIKTPILVIEGKKDDICGLGQTECIASYVSSDVVEYKSYDVGHYGCFDSGVWRSKIASDIKEFTNSVEAC